MIDVAQREQSFKQLGVPEVWAGRSSYTLLDLADEYGARFVSLWDRWRREPGRCARLHGVLVVPTLPSRDALRAQLLSGLPSKLHDLARQLVEQWPLCLPGVHRLEFESLRVTLTLAVGSVPVLLPRLSLSADAVILSSALFVAPSQQQTALAAALSRLIKKNAALLTLTATPVWPAGLESHLTFHAQAVLQSEGSVSQSKVDPSSALKPVVFLSARVSPRACPQEAHDGSRGLSAGPQRMIVVGGGFAGMHVAQAMALRGWEVTVLEAASELGGGQHGHLAAALTPVVSRDDDQYARLSRAGSLRAQARWAQVPDSIVMACGAIQLQRASGRIVDLKRIVEELAFPQQWLQFVDAGQASALAGMTLGRGGFYFPTARRVRPEALLDRLAQTEGVQRMTAQVARVESYGQQWRLRDRSGKVIAQAPQVVLAGGLATQQVFEASGLLRAGSRLAAMYGLGGELTYLAQTMLAGGPRCIVSGDGYILPAIQGQCVLGSSYLTEGHSGGTTVAGRQENLVRVASLLGQPLELSAEEQGTLKGWVGQRAVVPDRFPVVGPVQDWPGLWLATGFASRGLTWASLAGDLIAATLTGEPMPLENDIIARISQN